MSAASDDSLLKQDIENAQAATITSLSMFTSKTLIIFLHTFRDINESINYELINPILKRLATTI